MKKGVLSIFLILGIFISLVSLVCAENETLISSQDSDSSGIIENEEASGISAYTLIESEDIVDSYGAKMRLLQLERALRIKKIQMENILNIIKDNLTQEDSDSLNSLIEEMNILIEQTDNVSVESVDQLTVEKFIGIKEDAKDVVESFREISRSYISLELKERLREEIREIERNQLNDLREDIKNSIREYNAEKAKKFSETFDIDDKYLKMIKLGEVNSSELRIELKKRYENMSEEEKNESRLRIINIEKEKNEIKERIAVEKEKIIEKATERLNERAKIIEEKGYQNVAKLRETIAEKIEQNMQKMETKAQEIKENAKEESKSGKEESEK